MTDRELLELAAKAAGIELWHEDVFTNGLTQKVSDSGILRWHPLINDGDALRLAVKLGIIIEYRREIPACFAYHYNSNLEVVQRNDQLDPYAATRRAIVRAAAEIGRQMP